MLTKETDLVGDACSGSDNGNDGRREMGQRDLVIDACEVVDPARDARSDRDGGGGGGDNDNSGCREMDGLQDHSGWEEDG